MTFNYEVILRIQDTRSSDRVDKYRCLVGEDRYEYVIKKYEEQAQRISNDVHPFGCWVLCNKLDQNGDFLEVIQ